MRYTLVLAIATLSACVQPQSVADPHAVGLNSNQWRTTVAASPSVAFDAAMRVLTDSSYKIGDARKDAGIIKTEYRKESDVQRGIAQVKTMNGLGRGMNYPIRLQLLVLAQGKDSSTLTITGEEMLENIGKTLPVDARTDQWRFVRGIGEAILASIR